MAGDFEERRRNAAGTFVQAAQREAATVVRRLIPNGQEMFEDAQELVHEDGSHGEIVEVVRTWIQDDEDVRFLDTLWQEPRGRRFLELTAEMMARSMVRRVSELVQARPVTAEQRDQVVTLLEQALQVLEGASDDPL